MPAAGPAPGIAYAGFWLRFAAGVLDGLIFGLLAIVIILIAVGSAPKDDAGNPTGITAGAGLLIVLGVAVLLAYQIILPAQGGTLGMRALKLRIARADNGANIGLPLSLGRWAVTAVISFVPFGSFLDVLWICWDERKQALHDKAVNTVVVHPIVPP